MRVIRVKGTGSASSKPDLVVIKFSIVSKNYNYDDALRDLNNRVNILTRDIVKAGFAKEDLKTTYFNVDTEYKYENGEKIFKGYIARQDLKLEFDYNTNVLNNLINIIAKSEAKPEFNIYFEVKDKEAFKNKVLADAVNNAKKSAKVIADTANVKLGRILNIIYDWKEVVYRSQLILEDKMMSLAEQAPQFEITPEDVKAQDNISIEWEIEDNM